MAGREEARKVVQVLMENPELYFACDTEVAELDLNVTTYIAAIQLCFSRFFFFVWDGIIVPQQLYIFLRVWCGDTSRWVMWRYIPQSRGSAARGNSYQNAPEEPGWPRRFIVTMRLYGL